MPDEKEDTSKSPEQNTAPNAGAGSASGKRAGKRVAQRVNPIAEYSVWNLNSPPPPYTKASTICELELTLPPTWDKARDAAKHGWIHIKDAVRDSWNHLARRNPR